MVIGKKFKRLIISFVKKYTKVKMPDIGNKAIIVSHIDFNKSQSLQQNSCMEKGNGCINRQ